jgi:hypothetical protein
MRAMDDLGKSRNQCPKRLCPRTHAARRASKIKAVHDANAEVSELILGGTAAAQGWCALLYFAWCMRQQTPPLQHAPPLQQSLFAAAKLADRVSAINAARLITVAVIFFMIFLLDLNFGIWLKPQWVMRPASD